MRCCPVTRTYCLNTKTCSCYYLAACCKKSNLSWSERKNGLINLPCGPPALGYSSERQKANSSFLFFLTIFLPCTFTQMYRPNRESWNLAFPIYLRSSSRKTEFLAGSSLAEGKPRAPLPLCHLAPRPPPRTAQRPSCPPALRKQTRWAVMEGKGESRNTRRRWQTYTEEIKST